MPDDRFVHRKRWFPVLVPSPPNPRRHRKWVIPAAPGVYAFYWQAELIYIGSAANLRKRIQAHANSFRWREGMTVKAACQPYGWEARERRLIERLRPSDNREWNRSKRPTPIGTAYSERFGSAVGSY
jgi:excinuclease UvrABC nuclease subunit